MEINIDLKQFCYTGKKKFSIKKVPSKIELTTKQALEYNQIFDEYRSEIDKLQSKMYAHNKYGLLLIFQAMDAAGKDGTIKHVTSGVNAQGINVYSFKQPSTNELEHDFMWRTFKNFPERGKITIFNRSYYEEVLVVKVHPEILTNSQLLPNSISKNPEKVFKNRYDDIKNIEKYAHRNGIQIMKFFLNVSKKEQGQRMIERIETPEKNWKFSEGDVKEREHWDLYMNAYEDCINKTSSENSPWYVIPADDKKTMRIIVCKLILEKLNGLDISYPVLDKTQQANLKIYKQKIIAQDKD